MEGSCVTFETLKPLKQVGNSLQNSLPSSTILHPHIILFFCIFIQDDFVSSQGSTLMDIWYFLRTSYKKRTALFSTHIREKSSFFNVVICVFAQINAYTWQRGQMWPPPPWANRVNYESSLSLKLSFLILINILIYYFYVGGGLSTPPPISFRSRPSVYRWLPFTFIIVVFFVNITIITIIISLWPLLPFWLCPSLHPIWPMAIIMHAEHHFPISKIIKKTLIIIITENIIRGISDIYCKFREEVGGIAVLLCKVNNLGELCNSDKSFNSGFALTLKE